VYRWIATGQLERDLDAEVHYRPRPPVLTKLDPYKPLIETRLARFPRLTATRVYVNGCTRCTLPCRCQPGDGVAFPLEAVSPNA